jgi:hypothetical protein
MRSFGNGSRGRGVRDQEDVFLSDDVEDGSDERLLQDCSMFFKLLAETKEESGAGREEASEIDGDLVFSEVWLKALISLSDARARTREGLRTKIDAVIGYLDAVAEGELWGRVARSVCEDMESYLAGDVRRPEAQ